MESLKLASEFPPVDEAGWKALVETSLKGRAFETLRSKTSDGIQVEPVYSAAHDAPALPAGPEKAAHAAGWTLMQRADMPELPAANEQVLEDLENGAAGISLVLPGAVTAGSSGVAVRDEKSLQRLFDGVELDLVSLRLDAGRNGRDAAQALLGLYKARLLDLSRCSLDLGLDPIGSFAFTGAIVNRADLAGRMGDMFKAATEQDHKGGIFCADARVYHGAGSSEAQELAFALATGVELMRLLEGAGVAPDAAARHISMLLTADAEQFVTMSKLRAARHLWARLLQVCGIDQQPLTLHVETSARMMSRRDPHVNMLRTTTAAFAAGVAGADSVTALPFSHALGLPDGFARRLARNMQTLLLEESHLGQVSDAAAGSGYAETLTGQLCDEAWALFQSIEAAGGVMSALESGLPQKLIGEVNAKRDTDIARRKQPVTGVSEFPNLGEAPVKTLAMSVPDDWSIGSPWKADMLECTPLAQMRLAEAFEAFRDASDTALAASGKRPTVFLATLGKPADFTVRATWMSNLLAAGGIDVVTGTPDEFGASGLAAACICSSDALYGEQAAQAAKALTSAGATLVMQAGKPGDMEPALSEAGVSRFIHAGQNMVELLQDMHTHLSVSGEGEG